jgi:NFU1 iron-sulfur cluster scaffold homolog, mitochondrial
MSAEVPKLKIMVQSTPNPDARKFILNIDLRTGGKASFDDANAAQHVPLAEELLNLPSVMAVHFFENVITITQDGKNEWQNLEEMVEGTLYSLAPDHDPKFSTAEEHRRSALGPEHQKVESILDEYIRPYLQGDGGDVELISLRDNIVTIRYEGACGTCPSAAAGTLQAIQGALRDYYDPEVDVVTL